MKGASVNILTAIESIVKYGAQDTMNKTATMISMRTTRILFV